MSDIQWGMVQSFRTNLNLSCGRVTHTRASFPNIFSPVFSGFYSTVQFNNTKKDFNNELFLGLFRSIFSFYLGNRMHYLWMFYTLHFGTKTRKYSIFFIEKERGWTSAGEQSVHHHASVSADGS